MAEYNAAVVLLVEDNPDILEANRQVFAHDGYTVLTAATLAEARTRLLRAQPDVIVLDIMLPDGDGLSFLPELRESCGAPVLFLTAKDRQEERLKGLRAGGNDYITKPYDIDELRIRVKNFLSLTRDAQNTAAIVVTGSLKLDTVAQQAFLKGGDMRLTPKEFALLHLFMRNIDVVLSTEYIYEKAWGQAMSGDDYPVKKAVSRLRFKLEESEFIISTHRGAGYCFYKE